MLEENDIGCWCFSGEVFDVVKESMDRKKLYAMMPGSSQHSGNNSTFTLILTYYGRLCPSDCDRAASFLLSSPVVWNRSVK